MIRYTKDNPKMIRRRSEIEHKKTAPGKGGIKKKKVYLSKKR